MTEPTEARRLAEELATEFHPHEEFCEKDRCVCEQVAKDFRDFLTERVEKAIVAGIVAARVHSEIECEKRVNRAIETVTNAFNSRWTEPKPKSAKEQP